MEMPDGKLQNLTHPIESINEVKWTERKKQTRNEYKRNELYLKRKLLKLFFFFFLLANLQVQCTLHLIMQYRADALDFVN